MFENYPQWFLTFLPDIAFAAVIIIGAALIEFSISFIYNRYRKKYGIKRGMQMTETALRIFVFFVAVILLLSSIPGLSTNTVRLVFGAVGVILALSSTTLIANAVSGVVIKFMRQYNVGDMVKIANNLGKVSEIGLLQTELQMSKRGIVKLPNSLVLKDAIFNYTAQKYIVHVPITLGYDIPRNKVEALLMAAVKDTGLKNPFVFILELGNNWVKYEANGLLEDTTKLVIVESNLRKNILDRFNNAGVEILSPDYVNLKKFPTKKKILPSRKSIALEKKEVLRESQDAEAVMFEKAKDEEEQAKRKEMDKAKILEAMTSKTSERNRVAEWAKCLGVKLSIWTKPEEIVERLATSEKVTLAAMKEFFGKTEEEQKAEEERKKPKKLEEKKSKFFVKI
ncbi:MAG: mechanosensitive ion channel domain-containing protein [archaeon]